jgi:hypothetical protein
MTSSRAEICIAAAEAFSPPVWAGDNDEQYCTICKFSFALLRKGHHCRNCGFLVCPDCSSKTWPSEMLPSTFHFNEKFCRVCDNCNFLTEAFGDALRYGDYEIAMSIYETNNINLQVPLSIYLTRDYPIHLAAEGGNLKLFKWLVEVKFCPLFMEDFDSNEECALLNAKGESALAIAIKFGNVDIMKYLVQEKGCSVLEIKNLSIAQRGLFVLLGSQGVLPSVDLEAPLDHFGDYIDKGNSESSYAVAVDSSNVSRLRNLPSAFATSSFDEAILFSKKDRRPPLHSRCKRKATCDRAIKQCLNTVRKNYQNLFSTRNIEN